MRTRTRAPGNAPVTKTTMPPARPTPCPFASRSVSVRMASWPSVGVGLVALLFVKRAEKLVGFVDQRLDAATRGVGLAAPHQASRDDEGRGGREGNDGRPHQRTTVETRALTVAGLRFVRGIRGHLGQVGHGYL